MLKIKNVLFTKKTKKMILFDNEETMSHAYKFLYGLQGREPGQIEHYKIPERIYVIEKLLKVFCVFRRQTVQRIQKLLTNPNPAEYVLSYAIKHEPLLPEVTKGGGTAITMFTKQFPVRLSAVLKWVQTCATQAS